MKNLKVSAKLVIGMGSILLLLIILAANNFSSLNQITTRTTNTGNIAYINNGVKEPLNNSPLFAIIAASTFF